MSGAATSGATAVGARTRGTPVLAYAWWHTRDSLWRAVMPVLLFLGIGGIPLWTLIGRNGLEAILADPEMLDNVRRIYTQAMTLAMTLGALVVASGYVATDRDRGHVRFLFSAPVVPWRYYLLRFVLGVALFVAAYTVVPLGMGALVTAVPVAPVTAGAALYGVLLGSLSMLAGALTRRDGAVVVGVTLVASVLQQLRRGGDLPGWADLLAVVLPPIDAADQLRTAWLTGAGTATGDLLYVVGYAVAMLAAALVIIRRAPLVR